MKSAAKNTENAKKRRTITIDITDCYERLSEISEAAIRTVEEQCRYFIKEGISKCNSLGVCSWDYNTTYPCVVIPEKNVSPYEHRTNVWCNANGGRSSADCDHSSK